MGFSLLDTTADVVSFPKLGLEITVDRVAFTIGGFQVYWYGLLIGIGLLLGILYAMKMAPKFGIDTDRMLDVILVGAICGVIGGRLYYVVFRLDEFSSFADVLSLRSGGMAIYGVLIGAFVSGVITCRKRRVNTAAMFDIAAMGFLMAQAIGRWGNFINEECFGFNTDLPWGMTSSKIATYIINHTSELSAQGMSVDFSLPVHPTFLYESLWCLLGFILLNIYVKRRRFDGEIFLMYAAWYGLGRAVIEGMRTDSLYIGTLRVSLVVGVLTAAVAALIIIRVRKHQAADPEYRPLYVNTEQCKTDLAEIAAERDSKKKRPGNDEKSAEIIAEDETAAAESAAEETAAAEKAKPETAPAKKKTAVRKKTKKETETSTENKKPQDD